MVEDKILVSIQCTVYNQEKYIKDCLDGFVMQKTNFKFEAIVHDDASTDGSAAIIREYAEKYPNIIKPILETENQYSKGTLSQIMDSQMRGKYIAVCEGDDYWTDPYKLQKQVDFMDSHLDYSMCFTNAVVKTELNNYRKLDENMYAHLKEKDYTGEELLETWSVPTASVMYRNIDIDNIPHNPEFMFGDIVWFLWNASRGKIHCLNEKMVVYRRHAGSATTSKGDDNHSEKLIAHYNKIVDVFGNKYAKIAHRKIIEIKTGVFVSGRFNKKSWHIFFEMHKNLKSLFYFYYCLARLIRTIIKYK
jgi:glycosyltransferase involved in cell wall biosynthesis